MQENYEEEQKMFEATLEIIEQPNPPHLSQYQISENNPSSHSANFENLQRLIFAIIDDDVESFDKLSIPIEKLPSLMFEQGLNILNLAIEHERVNMVLHLDSITKNHPKIREDLLKHKIRKDQITALH